MIYSYQFFDLPVAQQKEFVRYLTPTLQAHRQHLASQAQETTGLDQRLGLLEVHRDQLRSFLLDNNKPGYLKTRMADLGKRLEELELGMEDTSHDDQDQGGEQSANYKALKDYVDNQ